MNVINIGSRRELFVDKLMVDTMDGAFLKLHEPVPMGPAIQVDQPWDGGANFGNSVLEADGKYYMYYRAMHCNTGTDPELHNCIAISDDGITWTKPVIQEEDGTNFVEVNSFLDTRPGVPKSERFKGFISEAVNGEKHTPNYAPSGAMREVFYASEDGIHFHKMDPQPELVSYLPNSFDGGCSMFWSEVEQQYVFYYRYSIQLRTDPNTPENPWHRSIAKMTSKDFYTWSKPERMVFSEPSEQIYVNNTAPYFRAPHIYLGGAARFVEFSRVLSEEQAKSLKLETNDFDRIWRRYTQDNSDGILLTTRAGTNVYDRTFMETFIRPGPYYGDWVGRTNYPLLGIIPYNEETMFMYVSRRYLQNDWYIERLALRTDGFASLSAPWKGGVATTKPFIYEGSELEINYRTGASGYVKVELLDADGNVIPGFHAEMCDRIIGNEIKRIVTWRSDLYPEYNLKHFAGTPVRLRFYMKDADLFSFKFN